MDSCTFGGKLGVPLLAAWVLISLAGREMVAGVFKVRPKRPQSEASPADTVAGEHEATLPGIVKVPTNAVAAAAIMACCTAAACLLDRTGSGHGARGGAGVGAVRGRSTTVVVVVVVVSVLLVLTLRLRLGDEPRLPAQLCCCETHRRVGL